MGIIYQITNTTNGDFYIGKTVRPMHRRFQLHKSAKDETNLHRAMRKYGTDKFTIEVLEEVVGNLDSRERHYIKELSPPYNMTEGGDGGDTSNSPNYKIGMEKHHSNQPKERYATYGMLGKNHPIKGKQNKKLCCPVVCEGVEYESVGAAEEAYPGIKVRHRLNSDKYPEFYRLRPRTRRA